MELSHTGNGDRQDPRRQPGDRSGLRTAPLLLSGLLLGLGLLLPGVRARKRDANKSSYHPAAEAKPPRRGHEHRDVSFGWIVGVLVFLAIGGIAIHLILGGYLSHLNRTAAPTDEWSPLSAGVSQVRARTLDYPRLQISPPLDLEAFRSNEEQRLNSYGWVNRTSGIVHIPISAAMKLVLKEGLPTRSRPGQSRTGPSSFDLIQQRAPSEHREKQGAK